MNTISIYFIFVLLLATTETKCIAQFTECTENAQISRQFHIKRNKPSHQDVVLALYSSSGCNGHLFSVLQHEILSCVETSTRLFSCNGTIESVWVKVINKEEMYPVLGECTNFFNDKYVNLATFYCEVGGTDPLAGYRESIGHEERLNIELDENYVPIESIYLPIQGECEWRYEIDGLWSTVVITIVAVAAAVILILFIALLIFVQKHRHEKRDQLDHQPLNPEETQAV